MRRSRRSVLKLATQHSRVTVTLPHVLSSSTLTLYPVLSHLSNLLLPKPYLPFLSLFLLGSYSSGFVHVRIQPSPFIPYLRGSFPARGPLLRTQEVPCLVRNNKDKNLGVKWIKFTKRRYHPVITSSTCHYSG